MGLQVPTPSPVRHGTASCRLLVLSQEDLPALTHSTGVAHRCPSASHWVGMTTQQQPKGFTLSVFVCAHAHVCVYVCHMVQELQ